MLSLIGSNILTGIDFVNSSDVPQHLISRATYANIVNRSDMPVIMADLIKHRLAGILFSIPNWKRLEMET